MDTEIVIALIALGGVFVSAMLAAISYFYKKDFEVKRSGRRLLYFLLEIRYAVLVSMRNPNDIAERYMASCKKIFIANGFAMDNEVLDKAMMALIVGHLENLSAAVKVEIDDELIKSYEKELLEFSNINPVLAFKLRGKQRVQASINETSKYVSKLNETFSTLPQTMAFAGPMSPLAIERRDEALSNLMDSLDKEILELSAYCGRRDYRESKKLLNTSRDKEIESPDLEKDLMEMVEQLAEAMNIDIASYARSKNRV
nr:hypothetical protein [Pseudomonas sp.]